HSATLVPYTTLFRSKRGDPPACQDFGEGLLEAEEAPERRVALLVLGPDAAGRAAHALAAHFERGDLPPGYLDVSAPLPPPQPPRSEAHTSELQSLAY